VEDVTDSEEESEDNNFIFMDPIDSSDLPGDESEIEMESEDEDDGFEEIQSDANNNPNTTQTLEYTKDKYNVKMRKQRVSPKVPPTTYKGQRIK
jgi:hypothetical protein